VGIKTSSRGASQLVKVTFTLEEAMKVQRGRKGIALLFHLGARWGWVINAKPRPLYLRETRYPL
jgi:hypothetical protein